MIDSLRLVSNFVSPSESFTPSAFQYKGLTFSPHFVPGTDQCAKFKTEIKNLHVVLLPDKKLLSVSNSLHHYFHGNNFGDFYLSEVKEAINQLSDTLSCDLSQARVTRLEYGCNLHINANKTYSGL